jgi:hypothetical protein
MPTIFTVFSFLISIVGLFVVCYCVTMLFCYISKRGLFQKPKVIIITEVAVAENSTGEGNDSSSSFSSASSSCSNSPARRIGNRRAVKTTAAHSKSARSTSSANNVYRPKRNNTNRSPTARAVSNLASNSSDVPTTSSASARNANPRSSSNRGGPASSRNASYLYAEPECYADFDSESPFLVPPDLVQKVNSKPTNSKQTAPTSTNSSSSNRNSNKTRNRATPTSTNRSAVSTSNETARVQVTNSHHLETIHSEVNSVSTRSSESLDFGARSLMDHAEIAETASASDMVLNSNRLLNEEREVETLSEGTGTHIEVIGSHHQATANAVLSMSSTYYLDEKPPSYDEIIRNSSSLA